MNKLTLRRISLVLIAVMSISCVAGCNRKIKVDYGYDSGDYVTKLGEYKNVEYTPDDSVVEETEIDDYVKEVLTDCTHWDSYVGKKAQMGDKLTIRIKATDENGIYLPEFSMDQDYELVLGSGIMSNRYENFEEKLVGIMPNFTKQIECKILEGFQEEEMVGKKIVFIVSVTAGYEGTLPEFTDSFVSQLTNGKYKTTKEYRAVIRKNFEDKLEEEKYAARYKEVIEQIMAGTEVSEYPEAVLQKQIKRTTDVLGVYSALQEMTEEEYCKKLYNCSIEEYSKRQIKQEMILQEVIKKEGLTLTTKEYKDNIEEFARENGFSDSELMLEEFDKEYVQKYMLMDKAIKFIYDSSVPKK